MEVGKLLPKARSRGLAQQSRPRGSHSRRPKNRAKERLGRAGMLRVSGRTFPQCASGEGQAFPEPRVMTQRPGHWGTDRHDISASPPAAHGPSPLGTGLWADKAQSCTSGERRASSLRVLTSSPWGALLRPATLLPSPASPNNVPLAFLSHPVYRSTPHGTLKRATHSDGDHRNMTITVVLSQ